MTHIAPLTRADHDAWLPLWLGYLEFYREELSGEQTELTFDRLVDPDFGMHGVLARDASGVAVGFAHWQPQASTWSPTGYCYLEDLFVDPTARGGGVGRSLIAAVTDWASAAGCSQVYWLTQSGNAPARALYDRLAEDTGYVHYAIELPARGAGATSGDGAASTRTPPSAHD